MASEKKLKSIVCVGRVIAVLGWAEDGGRLILPVRGLSFACLRGVVLKGIKMETERHLVTTLFAIGQKSVEVRPALALRQRILFPESPKPFSFAGCPMALPAAQNCKQ